MPRLSDGRWVYAKPDVHMVIELPLGPHEFSVEQLAVAWEVERDRIMEKHFAGPPLCRRPWGWWKFEAGEEEPPEFDDEKVRLAELGALTAEELTALREDANEARLRIGTDAERFSGGGRKHGVPVDVKRSSCGMPYRRRAATSERDRPPGRIAAGFRFTSIKNGP